jgi:CubicO group peptidase (beta-lactamase class C family)
MPITSSSACQHISVAASLLCLLAAPAFAAPTRMSDEQIVQDLRMNTSRLARENKFSGTVLLAKEGKILFVHAYGLSDRTFDVPNNIDTKFNLGSMGKMFTGVSIMQLVEQGKMSLDDKLIKDFPDYPNKDVANKITIRQLLTHTSGLGDFFGPEFDASSMAEFDTLESLLPLFVNKPLLFKPGTKWSYSNAAFIVLGLVIQHLSGESYYNYVREHVFAPAGMSDTGNEPWDWIVPNRASGYTAMGMPPGQLKSNIFMLQRGGSAGGGYSTVSDLLRFSKALQGDRLLSKTYTDMYMTGEVTTTRPAVSDGLGIFDEVHNGVHIHGHSGGAPGVNSVLSIYPSLDYVVAIMTNFDNDVSLVNDRLRMELTGVPLPQAIHLSSDALQAFAGKYAIVPLLPPGAPVGMHMTSPPVTVSVDRDGLTEDVGIGPKLRILPLSADTFFGQDDPSRRINFTRNGKGDVTGLTDEGTFPVPGPITAVKEP